MKLWIRSQDREILIKIDNVGISNENLVLGNLVSDDNKSVCDYWILGQYKTKRRALEIIDEIQEFIEKQGTNEINIDDNGLPNGVRHYGNVYQMPEE